MILSSSNSRLLLAILLSAPLSNAKPYPREPLEARSSINTLELRAYHPCGLGVPTYCSDSEWCDTSGALATCRPYAEGSQQAANNGGGSGGNWVMITTTYIQTDLMTITSTYSTQMGAAPTQGSGGLICNTNIQQKDPCGGVCCSLDQFCSNNQCINNGGSTGGVWAPAPTSASNSAFIRPTSNTIATVTATGSATATLPFSSPIGTDGSALAPIAVSSGSSLSPGAIAGIVIGVLLGLFILFLICACLCCKGILDGILAIFGIGKKKRTEETYITSHHSHHSGHGSPPPRRWFGMRPARADKPPKKSSGLGGVLGVGGLLAALAIILGLKRKHDKHDEKSSYGSASSYTTYTSYTTTSASK